MAFELFSIYGTLGLKDDGFEKGIDDATNAGKGFGSSVKGIISTVAGLKVVSAAFDLIKGSIDGAISRYDTLVSFPKVMQQMGYSAEESQASITKLSEGIQGLPTALDDIVASTKSIALLTGDLEGATDTALALNNAFYASGASTDEASRGLIQYNKMLSTGTVEAISWRTLQQTMGYALRETAAAFGYVTEEGVGSTEALKNALQDSEITFSDFNNKLIELNEGVGGFAETASIATDGIGTAMANLKTRTVMGVTSIIEALDEGFSQTRFVSISNIINTASNGIKNALKSVAPVAKTLAANVDVLAVSVTAAGVAFGIGKTITAFAKAQNAATKAVSAAKIIQTAMNEASAKDILLKGLQTTSVTKGTNAELIRNVAKKAGLAVDTEGNLVTASGIILEEAEAAALLKSAGAVSVKSTLTALLSGQIGVATAAQWLWNAAMAANPIGLIVIVVAALAAGIMLLAKRIKDNNAEMDALTDSARAADDTIKELNKNFDDSVQSIESNAIAASALVDELANLEAQGKLTDKQQRRYAQIVDQLNSIMPELNAEIDAQTGFVKGGTAALKANIEAQKAYFLQQAVIEKNTEIYKAQADVTYDLIQLQDKLDDATAEQTARYEDLAKATGKTVDEIRYMVEVLGLQGNELVTATGATGEAADSVMAWGNEAYNASIQINDMQKAVEANTGAIADYDAQLLESEQQILDYQNTNAATATVITEVTDAQKSALDALVPYYTKVADAATDMFGQIDTKSKYTMDEMQKNLEHNTEVVAQWSADMEYLAQDSLGLDSGFLYYLQQLGPESAALIHQMANASPDQLKELSDAYAAGGQAATDAFGQALGLPDEVTQATANMVAATKQTFQEQIAAADFESLGENVLTGYVNGITANTADATDAGAEIGTATVHGTSEELSIASPSKVYEKLGLYTVQGYAIGIIKNEKLAIGAAKDMVSDAAKAAKTQVEESDFPQIGKMMANGIAAGVESGASGIISAMTNAVNSAISAAKKAADIHSPSRRTRDELGENMMLGWAIGIEENTDIVFSQMESAVDDVMRVASGAEGLNNKYETISVNGTAQNGPYAGGPIVNQYIQADDLTPYEQQQAAFAMIETLRWTG